MLLKELIEGLDILSSSGSTDIEIENIAYDSRKARKGTLFVCVEGFKDDGHNYVPTAIENGATAILAQRKIDVPDNVTLIITGDTRYGLAYLSNEFFGNPSKSFDLIGVTGTKGKTTTTYMIKAILETASKKVGLIGTISNKIGNEVLPTERTTPESHDLQQLFSEMIEKKVESVVMEVSSHALELHRVSCSDFDIGIFTNLTQDHLDFHVTFDNYLNAKAKLFKMCKKGLVNIDSEYGKKVIEKAECEIITIGIENDADIKAVDIVKQPDSVEFKVITPWGSEYIKVNIPGKFNVYNALAAIGACCLMKIPFADIKEGLEKVSVPGRAEVVYSGNDFTVIIDYAHSPDSLENILNTVKGYAPARVVSLFGCGGDRDKSKRSIMGEISGKIADFTILTSDNPRTEEPIEIIKDIEQGIKSITSEYITIEDRKEAIKYAISNVKPKDIIILAGKGHETYQIFKDKTIHFDEREVVKELLNK